MIRKILSFSIVFVFIVGIVFYYGYLKKYSTNITAIKIQDDFNNIEIPNTDCCDAILISEFDENNTEKDIIEKESNYSNSYESSSLKGENKNNYNLVDKEEKTNAHIINQSNENNNSVIENKTPKVDKYSFIRNDSEIQRMIGIAKNIILKNENNRCDGLVNQVDNIEFIIAKSGNVFYPFFESRIENIVIDNIFPKFYVYAEDIYLNGVYQRTEYYFQ